MTNAARRGAGSAPGAKRRRAGQELLLELALALVEQRDREAALVHEPALQGALADACGRGDVIHRDARDTALGEQPLSCCQHPQPVRGEED